MSRAKNRSPRLGVLLAAVAITLSAASWVWVEETAAQEASPVEVAAETSPRALIADGNPPDLFLLYTGDVIGYLDPCG